MAKATQGQWVVPNPQICRSFGLMNIIFGGIMLLVGAYYVAMFFLTPVINRYVQVQVQTQRAAENTKIEAKLAELKEKEKTAKDEDEKKALADERAQVELSRDLAGDLMGDMNTWNMYKDKRVAIYFWLEVTAGIVLNVLMIIAGAGLLALRDWARRMGVWVASLKIVRWVAMTAVTLVLIVPIMLEKTRPIFTKVEAQIAAKAGPRPAPFSMSGLAQFTAIMSAVMTVVSAVVASVYPALSIWYLTRPRARAACLAHAPPPVSVKGKDQGESW
jgi:hypothetical protein